MSEIVLLTTTYYISVMENRFHLCSQAIGDAVGQGYPFVIVDGSPNTAVSPALTKIGAKVFPQQAPGMGQSRRELFGQAQHYLNESHPPIFVWLEPEKVDLIRLLRQIIAPISGGWADMVVPTRSKLSWQSCSQLQVQIETKMNQVFSQVTGHDLDICFGPVAFSSLVLPIFANCKPHEKYGLPDNYVQQVAVMESLASGLRVVSVEVDFFYPPIQTHKEQGVLKETMRKKRQQQHDELTHTYCLVAKALGLSA